MKSPSPLHPPKKSDTTLDTLSASRRGVRETERDRDKSAVSPGIFHVSTRRSGEDLNKDVMLVTHATSTRGEKSCLQRATSGEADWHAPPSPSRGSLLFIR
ncbi:hypothetical protein XA68_13481 [Ophiocordyceps unilateralis]|uniref:Uncharacterized protein n=1 Tax=Ophiocordyceps unilateralis TaxID=268505 RepID=A0A2A9PAZ6_OPHUN|nr:hypothetical protein XA68_13481 [Ophiocordyceps unilateralis]